MILKHQTIAMKITKIITVIIIIIIIIIITIIIIINTIIDNSLLELNFDKI